MTYPRAVVISWVSALLLLLVTCHAFAGDWYGVAGGGVMKATCTICGDDGSFVQMGLPHSMRMSDFSYKVGLGYQGNGPWGIEAAYLNLGTVSIHQAYTVGDTQYDPKQHRCLSPCQFQGTFDTHDLTEGVEIAVRYLWREQPIQPYLRLGVAGFYHRLTAQWLGNTMTMHGWVPSSVLGAGVQYGWLYAEGNYYRGIGGSTDWSEGLPLSKEQVVGVVGIRVPF